MRRWMWAVLAVVVWGGVVRAGEEAGRWEKLAERVRWKLDVGAVEELKKAEVGAVEIVERAAAGTGAVDEKRARILIDNLGSAMAAVATEAGEQLRGMGPRAGEMLRAAAKSDRKGGEEGLAQRKEELAQVVESRPALRMLNQVLETLYRRHAEALFAERWARLGRDLHDERAQQFLCGVGMKEVWGQVEKLKREEQLKFLLTRVHGRMSQAVRDKMAAFSAKEVLEMAAATYWPVEIEKLDFDGSYGWTTRAARVDGNVATEVVRFGIEMPGHGNEPRKWLFCDSWLKWTYVFRFGQMHANRDAVVVAENTPLEERLETDWKVYVGCNTVRGVPASVRVVVAEIDGNESSDWHVGCVYEWARAYMPKEYVGRLTFRANRRAAPVVRVERGDGKR